MVLESTIFFIKMDSLAAGKKCIRKILWHLLIGNIYKIKNRVTLQSNWEPNNIQSTLKAH